MHLEVFEGESGIWFVRMVGGNEETVMVSEGYDSKGNAVRSANVIAGITGLDIILVNGEPGD